MMHNNKMMGADMPAQELTKKDVMEVAFALATLLTLCPAMILSVQLITRIL